MNLDADIHEVRMSVQLGPCSARFQRLTREIAGDLGFSLKTGTLRTFGHGVIGCYLRAAGKFGASAHDCPTRVGRSTATYKTSGNQTAVRDEEKARQAA